jgi:hypothetical protein
MRLRCVEPAQMVGRYAMFAPNEHAYAAHSGAGLRDRRRAQAGAAS